MRIIERKMFKLLHRIQNIEQNKKIGVGGRKIPKKEKNVDKGFLVFGLNTEYRIQNTENAEDNRAEEGDSGQVC